MTEESTTTPTGEREIWAKVTIKDTQFKPDSRYLVLVEPISQASEWVTADQIKALEATEAERAKRDRAMLQRIDNAHAEVYSVWNGSDLSAIERNHLESALTILSHIIEELRPAGETTS